MVVTRQSYSNPYINGDIKSVTIIGIFDTEDKLMKIKNSIKLINDDCKIEEIEIIELESESVYDKYDFVIK